VKETSILYGTIH